MRSKILYYLRFVFGFSQSELNGIYSLFLLLLVYVLTTLYLRYEEEERLTNSFEPKVWNSALVKLPKERKWLEYKNGKTSNKPWKQRNMPINNFKSYVFSVHSRKLKQDLRWTLDINTADSTAWVGLKGIGPSFAKRILTYRERLGGFNSVLQLKEVYGLDSVWVDENKLHLKIGAGVYRKLRVNHLPWNDFRHPYLPYAQVKLFLSYRRQHPFVSIYEELESIHGLDLGIWFRLKPYLSFEP